MPWGLNQLSILLLNITLHYIGLKDNVARFKRNDRVERKICFIKWGFLISPFSLTLKRHSQSLMRISITVVYIYVGSLWVLYKI